MDLLDRLLKHDAHTTRQLIDLCLPLPQEQLDQQFKLGLKTARATLIHIVDSMACWTDLMTAAQPMRPWIASDAGIQVISDRFDKAAQDFHTFARQVGDENRFNDTFIDHLDQPPRHKTYGAGILHLTTHSMHHRAQLLFMLRQLGVENVPEGDAMGWENHHTGGWKEA